MRYRSANPKKRKKASDVLPCLQNRDYSATSIMDFSLPTGSIRAAVLFQLLVSFADADHFPFLDSRQLPRTVAGERLLPNPVSFHVDRGSGNALLFTARLSPGLLPIIPRRQEERAALPTRDHSAVGE